MYVFLNQGHVVASVPAPATISQGSGPRLACRMPTTPFRTTGGLRAVHVHEWYLAGMFWCSGFRKVAPLLVQGAEDVRCPRSPAGTESLSHHRACSGKIPRATKIPRVCEAWRGLAAPPSRPLSILLDGPLAWTFWILGRPPRSWSTPLVEKTLLALGWLTPLGSL